MAEQAPAPDLTNYEDANATQEDRDNQGEEDGHGGARPRDNNQAGRIAVAKKKYDTQKGVVTRLLRKYTTRTEEPSDEESEQAHLEISAARDQMVNHFREYYRIATNGDERATAFQDCENRHGDAELVLVAIRDQLGQGPEILEDEDPDETIDQMIRHSKRTVQGMVTGNPQGTSTPGGSPAARRRHINLQINQG